MHFTTFSDGFGYSKFSSIFQISTYLYGLYEIYSLIFPQLSWKMHKNWRKWRRISFSLSLTPICWVRYPSSSLLTTNIFLPGVLFFWNHLDGIASHCRLRIQVVWYWMKDYLAWQCCKSERKISMMNFICTYIKIKKSNYFFSQFAFKIKTLENSIFKMITL